MTNKKEKVGNAFCHIYLIVLSLIAVFPLVWVLLCSVKSSGELTSNPTRFFPKHFTLENFTHVIQDLGFAKNIGNSLIIAIITTGIAIVISSMAAYGIVRFFPKLGSIMSKVLVATYMFPPILLAIPYSMVMAKLGLVTSIDGGETWSDRVPLTEIATTSYGTQLSVINYSQPIDGKPAIILSAPNATNGRKNGKIWIGLINETGQSGVNKYSVEWKYCYSVDTPQMGYSYSCLTELPDGKVGLLYEKYDSWSRNELHLKNILKYEKFTIDELKVQP